jgi:beta-fructofuranosidase
MDVCLNSGLDSATTIFSATQPLTLMTLNTSNLPHGTQVIARIKVLDSSWQAMQNRIDGLVYGNNSMHEMGSEDIHRLLR